MTENELATIQGFVGALQDSEKLVQAVVEQGRLLDLPEARAYQARLRSAFAAYLVALNTEAK